MWQCAARAELGGSGPRASRAALSGCLPLMCLQRKLTGHAGCVNTVSFDPSGRLLLSGSDDTQVTLWDWDAGEALLRFDSGHTNNVFQARMLPHSGGCKIVTCAADGQVRLAELPEGAAAASAATSLLGAHAGRAHKLALDPLSPAACFYSCGEDGQVFHFDLRARDRAPRSKLLLCHGPSRTRAGSSRVVGLNAITVNPLQPCLFAVGGNDPWARVYDARRTRDSQAPATAAAAAAASGAPPGGAPAAHGSARLAHEAAGQQRYALTDEPVARLSPAHLASGGGGLAEVNITCVAFSQQGELLASYNDEDLYLFSARAAAGWLSPGNSRYSMSNSSSDTDGSSSSGSDAPSSSGRGARAREGSSAGSPGRRLRAVMQAAGAGSEDEGEGEGEGGRPRVRRRGPGQQRAAAAAAAEATAEAAAGGLAGSGSSQLNAAELAEAPGSVAWPRLREAAAPAGVAAAAGPGPGSGGSTAAAVRQRGAAALAWLAQRRDRGGPWLAGGGMGVEFAGRGAAAGRDGVVARFYGHRNAATVKGAAFFGQDDEFVMSGSDCGHVFIWSKDTGQIVWWQHADEEVVNCLESHPFLPLVLATSGIEHDIKLWGPSPGAAQVPDPAGVRRQMGANRRDRDASREAFRQPEQWLLQLLAAQQRRAQQRRAAAAAAEAAGTQQQRAAALGEAGGTSEGEAEASGPESDEERALARSLPPGGIRIVWGDSSPRRGQRRQQQQQQQQQQQRGAGSWDGEDARAAAAAADEADSGAASHEGDGEGEGAEAPCRVS